MGKSPKKKPKDEDYELIETNDSMEFDDEIETITKRKSTSRSVALMQGNKTAGELALQFGNKVFGIEDFLKIIFKQSII